MGTSSFEFGMDFRDALFFVSDLFGEYSTSFVAILVVAHVCSSQIMYTMSIYNRQLKGD